MSHAFDAATAAPEAHAEPRVPGLLGAIDRALKSDYAGKSASCAELLKLA